MLRRISLVLGLALLTLGLALPASAQEGTARVRVIHASPDAPAVDVFVDGNAVLTSVAFPAISDYLEVPAGERSFAVAPAGQGESAAVIETTQTLAAGEAYTIAAVGLLANIQGQVYNDNLAAPAAGNAHVRVIHASPDAPAVAVRVAGGDTLIPSLAFPNASDYLPVPAGTYDLQVTPASDLNTAVLDLAGTTLEAGTIYDVVAVGQLANIAAEVATFTPEADDAAAAASPSASAPAASAPAASAPAAGGTPNTLPNTGVGENLSIVLIGLGVLALAGGFLIRRRTA